MDNKNVYSSKVKDEYYKFSETKDKIYCYIPLSAINLASPIYLEVEQSKEVQKTITSKFLIFIVLTFALFLIVNFILFKIIQNTIIKRILQLNKQLYELDSYNLSLFVPSSSNINDEISDLSKEISNMFAKISSSNEALRNNELKNRKVIDTMTNGFIYCKSIVNSNNLVVDGEILDTNFSTKTFFNIDDITSKLLSSTDESFSSDNFISHLNNSLRDKKIGTSYEIKFTNNKWALVSINSILDGYFFIVINDVTTLKSYSEEMKHIATYDALTSIFNRRKLIEHAESLVKNNIPYSLFFIDLDNFKKVNDTIGHDEGDIILKGVSSDLSKLLSKNIKIGRLGGDEFVVIKEGTHNPNEIMKFGHLISKSISREYVFKAMKFDLQSSIGVDSYPLDSQTNSTVMKYADIAMYKAKSNDGNSCIMFTKSLLHEYDLEDKINEAIINKEFTTYYQPIYNLATNRIDSAEALVRWHSPTGIIPPNEFIPIAKRSGSIIEIDKIVFTDSCALCNDWYIKYGQHIIISINISYGLLIKENFTDFVLSTIQKYNVPSKFIKLEITEDEIIEDIAYVISLLTNLRKLGFLVALDDFGIGYSS
ncbi:MAG: EAL domain-containing protein, partial [Clostridium sp.]